MLKENSRTHGSRTSLMKIQNILATVAGSLILSCAFLTAAQQRGGLKVDLADGQGKAWAQPCSRRQPKGVNSIRLNVMNSDPPGDHGIHIPR